MVNIISVLCHDCGDRGADVVRLLEWSLSDNTCGDLIELDFS